MKSTIAKEIAALEKENRRLTEQILKKNVRIEELEIIEKSLDTELRGRSFDFQGIIREIHEAYDLADSDRPLIGSRNAILCIVKRTLGKMLKMAHVLISIRRQTVEMLNRNDVSEVSHVNGVRCVLTSGYDSDRYCAYFEYTTESGLRRDAIDFICSSYDEAIETYNYMKHCVRKGKRPTMPVFETSKAFDYNDVPVVISDADKKMIVDKFNLTAFTLPYGCIYGVKSNDNKWYIGKTTRWIDSISGSFKRYPGGFVKEKGTSNFKIANAIKENPKLKFSDIVILALAKNEEELTALEYAFMLRFNSLGEDGYNISDDGRVEAFGVKP